MQLGGPVLHITFLATGMYILIAGNHIALGNHNILPSILKASVSQYCVLPVLAVLLNHFEVISTDLVIEKESQLKVMAFWI